MESPSGSHDHNLEELVVALEARSNMKAALLIQINFEKVDQLRPKIILDKIDDNREKDCSQLYFEVAVVCATLCTHCYGTDKKSLNL